jgi:hypothetical protein
VLTLCVAAPKHVTVSTSGVAPMIERVGTELGARLAVSLHAPNDVLRSRIMSINKSYPLATVMEACRRYSTAGSPWLATPSGPKRVPRKILFEYVVRVLRGRWQGRYCCWWWVFVVIIIIIIVVVVVIIIAVVAVVVVVVVVVVVTRRRATIPRT